MAKKPANPAARPDHAAAVDPSIKASNLRRLSRIEGQVRGIAGMVGDDRYCADVLDQIAAVQQALRAVARETLRNHLKHCAAGALGRSGDEAEQMQDELLKLFDKRMY